MRVSRRIFYAFTTRIFNRNKWLADDGVREGRAGIHSSQGSASPGPPATHGAYDGLDAPQLFLAEEPEVIAPEPPTWRVFLNSMVDTKDYTASEIKLRVEQIGFERGQLDEEMDGSWWEMHYDRYLAPPRRRIGCSTRSILVQTSAGGADGPHLQFMEDGGNQFDYSLHVHASDELALSLLQARLIDLQLPIKVERWEDR